MIDGACGRGENEEAPAARQPELGPPQRVRRHSRRRANRRAEPGGSEGSEPLCPPCLTRGGSADSSAGAGEPYSPRRQQPARKGRSCEILRASKSLWPLLWAEASRAQHLLVILLLLRSLRSLHPDPSGWATGSAADRQLCWLVRRPPEHLESLLSTPWPSWRVAARGMWLDDKWTRSSRLSARLRVCAELFFSKLLFKKFFFFVRARARALPPHFLKRPRYSSPATRVTLLARQGRDGLYILILTRQALTHSARLARPTLHLADRAEGVPIRSAAR